MSVTGYTDDRHSNDGKVDRRVWIQSDIVDSICLPNFYKYKKKIYGTIFKSINSQVLTQAPESEHPREGAG